MFWEVNVLESIVKCCMSLTLSIIQNSYFILILASNLIDLLSQAWYSGSTNGFHLAIDLLLTVSLSRLTVLAWTLSGAAWCSRGFNLSYCAVRRTYMASCKLLFFLFVKLRLFILLFYFDGSSFLLSWQGWSLFFFCVHKLLSYCT